MKMKLVTVVILVFLAMCFAITQTLAQSLSKPGCQEKCGNVTIPYPFGIGSQCSANSSFALICQNSTNPPKPFLKTNTMNFEVLNISLYGILTLNLPMSPMNCSQGPTTQSLPLSLGGSPFTISAEYNTFVVMGCTNSVWLRANETVTGGCTAICDANSRNSSCNGINCCQIAIPTRLRELRYTYQSARATTNSTSCGYVFPVDKKWLRNEESKGLEFGFAPLVLEWEYTNSSIIGCKNPNSFSRSIYITSQCSSYMSRHNLLCRNLLQKITDEYSYSLYYLSVSDYVSAAGYCSCPFKGNPYVPQGCRTSDSGGCRYNECAPTGNYYNDKRGSRVIIVTFIALGSVVGALILLTLGWKFGKAIVETIRAIKASRKYMFFKRNGGILLEQQLAMIENGLDKTRLFTSVELAKATDDYNENRVLGRGGEGVVYKGMLEDGRIVAVKKSESVKRGDVEDFINEVVIVSQINHRNVVKLLGCCLESDVPRLVYEFVPNGTLFSHIHNPHEDFPLFWEMRVRIAKQVAGALAYLHSSASVPIYHRDIKSTNILLDEKYQAKISDFGTSRSISLDQTHVTTRVVGTFGYLDPEYFQSSQFTEKSDVYSFGVVLVELLTGEKAISAVRVEEGRGLAMHFLHSMEENQVLDIIDARVLREATKEEIMAMANIAKRCLHLNGKGRPTMKEVARDLDAIQVEKQESDFSENQIENNGYDSVGDDDDDDSDGFSSISERIEALSFDET